MALAVDVIGEGGGSIFSGDSIFGNSEVEI
jgi:hypothetical protein